MRIKTKPFSVPNFVLQDVKARPRQDGFHETPSFPLSDFDGDELSAMCDEFRAAVFRKAGKQDPKATT
jgi:hypothetical protein